MPGGKDVLKEQVILLSRVAYIGKPIFLFRAPTDKDVF